MSNREKSERHEASIAFPASDCCWRKGAVTVIAALLIIVCKTVDHVSVVLLPGNVITVDTYHFVG